jgi:predicted AlkP superfamily phosphohydrolase/phosphomutase
MNELKMKIKKEEVTHDRENLRNKSQTETQNTVEGHSSRVEDRISELENKIEIKEKAVIQTTQDLGKEYTRTHQLHQKTKFVNHGHCRSRKGSSKRDS